MTTPYLVQEPQQIRSQQTMNEILVAAANILESKSFDELTVAEVVNMAGTSVGAFYGRFKDKDGLLQALDEHFFERFSVEFEELIAPSRWADKSIKYIIHDAAQFIVEVYSRDRGVLRSLNLRARSHNDDRFRKREEKAWKELFPKLQAALLTHRREITHPEPERATYFAFQQMFFSMREIILWEPLRGEPAYREETLVEELSHAFFAYLTLEQTDDEQ